MDDESGDDERDGLTSGWGGESREEWRGWRNKSGSWFQRRGNAYLKWAIWDCVSVFLIFCFVFLILRAVASAYATLPSTLFQLFNCAFVSLLWANLMLMMMMWVQFSWPAPTRSTSEVTQPDQTHTHAYAYGSAIRCVRGHDQNIWNKQLSCRRETARRFVSLKILLSHSRSLKVIRNDTPA